MKLADIASRLGCELAGDGAIEITGVAPIESAAAGKLTFLANKKYAPKVKGTQASAIVAAEPVEGLATIVSNNPYHTYSRVLAMFYQPPRPKAVVDPSAAIAATAQLAEDVSIGAYAVVGENARIGRGTVLHPHVVVYDGAVIGEDCTLHSGSVVREFCRLGNRVVLQNGVIVGGDGFGFAKTNEGRHDKIVQSGVTVIEDDVEIQTLSSIDRASMGETRVKRGAKIDSLVQVGHSCVVGEDNVICAQTGLAGTTILEKNVLLAGQVGISGHLTIHENSVVYAQSGVGHDVPAGSVISGSPAFDAKVWLRAIMAFQKLPELLRAVRQLEKSNKTGEARE